MSLLVDNPVAAMVLNMDMRLAANAVVTSRPHHKDDRLIVEKERMRTNSALKATRPGMSAHRHKRTALLRTKPDVNIIVGVSDLRAPFAAIHSKEQTIEQREKHIHTLTVSSLQALRLAALMETTASVDQFVYYGP